jgi:hypothetical protein
MERTLPRREFLRRTASLAAVAPLTDAVFRSPAATSAKAGPPTGDLRSSTSARDYPIRAIPFTDVRLTDEFWLPKIALNASITIPQLAARDGGRGLEGNVLEAAIRSLQTHPDPALQRQVDARVAQLASRQPRGNSGFEIAVAYFQATGRRDLLDPAIATADALGAEFAARNPPFNGGERDAINCIQLYRATRNAKHLDLAKHYLDIRGLETSVDRSRHNQSYMPVTEQSEAVGHAVNCASLMVSLLDVGVLTGLEPYAAAARRMWTDATTRKMYVTGGIGSTGNEGFGEPYVLPNISAYAETCAVLMFTTLNHKLFLGSGDAKYIDVLERGIYNNALSGVSTKGDQFFYVNRLASAGDGRDARWTRASLECCPPNLVRFLAQMPGYVYAQDDRRTIYVNLYVSSEAAFQVGEDRVALAVQSGMPWDGRSTIRVTTPRPVRAALKLRIPGWARNQPAPGGLYSYAEPMRGRTTIDVNGRAMDAAPDPLGYTTIDREWRGGDRIEIAIPFDIHEVHADTRVAPARGRVAVERGPIVYCAEWPDVDDRAALGLRVAGSVDASDTRLDGPSTAPLLRVSAARLSQPNAPARNVDLIPYHLWANRGAGEMSVWLATRDLQPGDVGPAGGLIFYVNPEYARDGWRYLEAAPVDQSAGAKWGCFRHAIAGAKGTSVGTGRQNTLDMTATCTERATAADLCAAYTLNGVGGWFLPSRDELRLMFRNLNAAGLGDFRSAGMADNCEYWTSSQETADMAWHLDFADDGRQHYDDKDYPRRVRAIRSF